MGVTAVYREHHAKHVDTLCGVRARFLSAKAVGASSIEGALKGQTLYLQRWVPGLVFRSKFKYYLDNLSCFMYFI